MRRILVFILIYSVVLNGINPPQTGDFPSGFWDKMEQQGIGQVYGDPGWLRKIADWKNNPLRDAQLEFYLPVLLGQYADVTETYFDAVDFQNLLFDDNPTGTMKEYYNEISYGNFLVDGTTDGWYQSTYTMAQAVDNVKQYVAEIAELADPDFDYTQFDNDGPDNIPNSGDDDGYVDGIIVVYSGCGAEWYPGNNNIWPHKSSLGSYEYETNDLGANGSNVIVKSYAVNPELAGGGNCYTNTIRPIGVYAHEFGHILGLPDLYDRDDSNGDSEGIGNWCLMAGGSWQGWGGDTPAHMSSWCKSEMGWLEPVVLSSDEISLNIPQVETSPYAVKIWEDDYFWSRYFLVENRQPVGFDSDLEGPGLIIYHVDENRRYGSYKYSSGPANDDETHKLVDVEEADGLDDMDNEVNRGDAGDPFPGTSNNFTFNDNSYPSASRYDNTETGIAVFNISSSDSLMTADVNIRPQYGYALAYDELGMSGSGWGYNDSRTHFGGVLFTPDVSGFLTEVDVGIRKVPIDFHILVYNSFDGTSPGSLLDSVAGYADDATWFSVPIDTVPVSAGVDFFIAVRMDTSYAISVDRWGEKDYRSYFSTNGMTYSTGIADYGDINLRAKISAEGFNNNNAPIASDDSFTTNEDTDYSGTLSASDVDGNALTFSIIDSTVNGAVTLSDPATGTFTYSPMENFNGSDSFTFSVSDGTLSDTAAVSINVTAVNDAPIASDDSFTTNEDTDYSGTLSASDVDGNALTFSIIDSTVNGTVTLSDPATGTFTYSPMENFNGSDSLTFSVSDGTSLNPFPGSILALSDTATVSITVTTIDDLPVVANPFPDITVNEDDPGMTMGDLKNVFLDVDEELNYSHVVNDTGLVFVAVTNDTVTLQFLADANGSTEIIFTATNPTIRASISDTMTITILPVNDAPSSFALNELDSAYITMDNFATDSITFTWDESMDIEEDELLYEFTASLTVNGQVKAEYNSSLLNDREMKIDYQSVFDEIFAAQAMLGEIEWDVSVSDGVEEIMSQNGALTLGVNASAAVLSINGQLLPEVFALHQNYPNPFNPVTTLRYDLPENGHVNIIIYNMLGRKVKTLIDQTQDAGYRSVIWDATNDYGKPVSAGIYLYQIQAGEYIQTKKMVLLK